MQVLWYSYFTPEYMQLRRQTIDVISVTYDQESLSGLSTNSRQYSMRAQRAPRLVRIELTRIKSNNSSQFQRIYSIQFEAIPANYRTLICYDLFCTRSRGTKRINSLFIIRNHTSRTWLLYRIKFFHWCQKLVVETELARTEREDSTSRANWSNWSKKSVKM